ncbi:MAG: 30S ribosomal protein S10 [Nanoarchaeota archaeon]
MGTVRIKLSSIDIDALNSVIAMIKEISTRTGINLRGPIPLPTRRMKITTRKSPCGNGTATFDRFEMRVHKRIIDMPAQDRVLHPLMTLKIPRSVQIKIDIKD